jgi:hypothetical protein
LAMGNRQFAVGNWQFAVGPMKFGEHLETSTTSFFTFYSLKLLA